MAEDAPPFAFPPRMPRQVAESILAQAYASIDEGKLLRRTNKLLRKRDIDPPMDVQYVAEPAVQEFEDGLGITLGCDILIYEPFPEMDRCIDAFEETLDDLLMKRVEKAVRAWGRRNPPTKTPSSAGP